MIKILLVDDQPLFVESLKISLQSYVDDIDIVGIAKNGAEAVTMATELEPEIILMDAHMPVMNGVEATRRIRESHPEMKIIMLSTYDEDEYVHEALHFGAVGYLLKDISPTELIAAIRALQSGIIQISPQIASRLINRMYSESEPKQESTGKFEWFGTLTAREREIFGLIAIGFDNHQISKKLGLAEQTVRNNISIIYSKLEVKDRFEIIQLANKLQYH